MATTGINGWRFPSYSDSPDVPRDLGYLAADISAWVATNPDLKGETGTTGPRGYSILNGSANPVAGTGVDGDFYINTTSNSIFGPKTSGAWGTGTSLGGNSVLNGTVDPTSANGSNGDFYINKTSNTIFGPKASGVWPTGTSMVGPQGTPGTTGSTGPKGDAAATIAVTSTTTSAAGTNAQVTNSGTSSNVLLNFVIPRGADGAAGAQGIPGVAGADGAQGAPGATPSLDPISTRIALNSTVTSSVGVNSSWFPTSTATFTLGLLGPINSGTDSTTRTWKNIYLTNAATVVSDERTKQNILPSDLGLSFINNLEPVKYNRIDGDRTHYGLIAQQVKSVLDEANVTDFGGWVISNVGDPLSQQALRYEEFISPLIKAVQELSARVKALEEA